MSRIRTNFITNRMANGAPTVSNGLVISGVTTCNATANQPLVLNNTTSNGQSSISFQSAGTTIYNVGSNKDGDGNIDFFVYDEVNNKHRFNIDASGKVGINSSDPSYPLEIYTAASAAWKFRIDTTVSDGAGFYQRSNGEFEMVLRDASNNNNYIAGTGGGLQFVTSGTEKVRIDSSGRLLVGQTSSINGIFGSPPPRFSVSTSTASPAIFATYSNNNYASRIDLLKSRNATIGSHTVVQSGDALGEIYFGGSDGDQFHGGALIQSVVESGVGNDDMPADLRFFTNGGATLVTERLRIDSSGAAILKNTAAATARSDFFGSLKPISQIASTWNAYHSLTRHDAGSSYGPYLMLAKNRNDAYNSNGAVQDNDECGNISFLGNDGTAFRESARIRGEVDGTPGSSQVPGAITFATNNGSGLSERLRISAQGYVTSPNQPSFNVTITTIGQINSNAGVIIFNNTTSVGNHNNGNHYNASNGRFTAPVAGRYQINARMLTNSSTTAYTIYLLRVNANHVGYIGHNHSDFWFMESGSFVLNLQANDYVDCYLQQHSGHGGHNYASFSGFLIG